MISICLPTYNALEYTKKFLGTLLCTDSEYELVVVDDCSSDGSQDFISTLGCKTGFHEENKGVSQTWNDLIDLSEGDYICIVNSDILLTPHWDTPLIKALEEHEVASPYFTEFGLPHDFPKGKDRRANAIPVLGSCFMFKRNLIDKIGHFPDFKLWYGDNWLGEKADCVHVPESYIHHFVSQSANGLAVKDFDKQIDQDQLLFNKVR